MAPSEQFRVRLSDPGDLAAALPHLVGFHPHESVVLVSLTGPGGRRVGLTVRADLLPAGAGPAVVRDAARSLAGTVTAGAPGSVVVAVVSEAPDLPGDGSGYDGLPHRALVHQLALALDAADVPVRETLLVRRGRWWSYDCPRPCCAPGAGTRLPPGTSELAAASAVMGQVVEADRSGLERRIAPVGFLAAAGMSVVCSEVGAAYADRLLDAGWDTVADESWQLLEETVEQRGPGAGAARLPDATVARLVWGLRDPTVRDRAMGLALGPSAAAAEALWAELTRRAPSPLDAVPATLLAVGCWARGDGAMANVALDRAQQSEPSGSLARLMRSALDQALPPADLRAVIEATLDQLGDRRSAC
jgi:hypothetical protein